LRHRRHGPGQPRQPQRRHRLRQEAGGDPGSRPMSLAVTGVYCAAATPFNADLSPDHGLLAEHCRTLLADGCHGIALLGTTGEANSLSVGERMSVVEAVLRRGVAPEQLLPGTGVAAIPETVELTRHALDNGIRQVGMLPPFYHKGVSDE